MEAALVEFGLSQKEIKVFIASQKTGSATANELAIKAGVLRSTTYELLESLRQKGVISSYEKDKKLYFESISPKQLLSLMKYRTKRIEQIIPTLEALRVTASSKPVVQVFIGKQGVKAILEDILNKRLSYWTYANADVFDKLNYYFPHFISRRIELKIPVRVIEEETAITRKHKAEKDKSFRQIRFSKQRFSATAFIYDKNVLFLDFSNDDVTAILITDKKIADLQREVFEILWTSARE